MKRPAPRQLALFGALGLSVAAAAWVAARDEPEAATAAAPRRALTATSQPTATEWPGAVSPARTAWPSLDDAVRTAWGEAPPVVAAPPAPPPAEPVVAVVAPPPTAPPFPYQLVGQLVDGASRAILNNAQRSAVVGVGEVLDGQWRVDGLDAGGLRVTYLPLGLAQTVPFVSALSAPSA